MLPNPNKRPKSKARIVCALLEKEGQLLAVQRSPRMRHPLKWEFPGGKVEKGESPEQALRREIREELCIEIGALQALASSTFDYGQGPLLFLPFVCQWSSGSLQLQEHQALRWLAPNQLPFIDWLAADVAIYQEYLRWREKNTRP